MNKFSRNYCTGILLLIIIIFPFSVLGGDDIPTQFTNQDSIVNTRHNMTQATMQNGQGSQMNAYRNDYGAVCVYCHTPHGANSQLSAPLWNRTFLNTSYTTYDTLNTVSLNSTVTQPGINSLTCLSCHDGTTAVDSIVNMPGSGQYDVTRETTTSDALLDAFQPGTGQTRSGDHYRMNEGVTFGDQSCLACHNPVGPSDASDFTVYAIGTDLTNDHPVGVGLPLAKIGIDFKDPSTIKGNIRFFDLDGDSRPDSNEIRFYDTGDGSEVECASCHDPHGVPLVGNGGNLTPSFLRVNNTGSQLCLTCHDK